MPNRLSGKTVLIVGAAGNLGPVWTQALLHEGAFVLGVGLGVDDDPTLKHLSLTSPDLLKLAELDVTKDVDLSNLAHELGQTLGTNSLDGIVMSAGIDSVPGTGRLALEEYDQAEWERIFRVNVFGIIGALNTFSPTLKNPSSVVMLGSLYGIVSPKPSLYSHFNGGQGSIKHPAYGASKAALVAAARQYGTHLAPRGIRVNTLTLGGVAAGQDHEFVEKFEAHVPQGKMLSVEDVTGAMVFLLSDDSRAMTAQNVVVDGGFSAW